MTDHKDKTKQPALYDKEYFKDRGVLEDKHYFETQIWSAFFKPSSVLICGCGMGQRVFCFNTFGILALGFDVSDYAIENNIIKQKVFKHDICDKSEPQFPLNRTYDLVVAYDLLEHLTECEIEIAINKMINVCEKYIIISVPAIGNPNLEKDPTHKTKRSEDWWIYQFIKEGLYQIPTPRYFPFNGQIYIFEKTKIKTKILDKKRIGQIEHLDQYHD